MTMDPGQFEQIYHRCGGMVARRCRSWLGDAAEADDIAQEVFIRAFRYDSYQGTGSLVGWLFRIADRLCIDALRRRKRWSEQMSGALGSRVLEALGSRADWQPALLMERLVARCSPQLLEVAQLAHVDGMAQEQIAEQLGLSRRTVGKRLQRFRALAEAVLGQRE